MKKTFAILLSIILTLSSFSFVFASEANDLQSVLTKVKSRVPGTEDYSDFKSNSYTSNNNVVYNFSWSDKENSKELEISCNNKGFISYYNAYNDFYNQETVYKGDKDLALKYALMLNPNLENNIIITDENENAPKLQTEHSYKIDLIHNNKLVDSVSGYITINSNDLSLASFSLRNYKEYIFPTEDFISKDEAIKSFKDKLGLKLIYKSKYDEKDITIYPAYVLKEDSDKLINAITGEVFDNSYRYYLNGTGSDGMANSEMSTDSSNKLSFSEAELKNIADVAGIIPISTIENKLRENKSFKIATDLKLQTYSIYKDYYSDRYTYRLNFENKNDNYQDVNVRCDAKTGEIFSYSRYFTSNKKSSLTDSDLNKLGANFAKALAGDKFGEYQLEDKDKGNLTYIRYVNETPFPDDSISVCVSKTDGSLESYNIGYTNADFPDIKDALSETQVADKMFEYENYDIKYYIERDEKGIETGKVVPAYGLDDYINLNPFTGEQNEQKDEDKINEYTDILGHYAEEQIKEMSKYGVNYEGNLYEPDKEITQKEFLAMLMAVIDSYNVIPLNSSFDYSDIIKFAKRNGYIKEEEYNADETTNRLLGAKCLSRAMGIERYALLNDIFVSPFKDTNTDKGYLALLKGMNIIKGDENGNFNPNGKLTRADTAILLYNYINNK